jgi:putative ABC transport system permease protein
MFKSYLQIALRHLLKQPALGLINVLGLSVGLACFCLIALYAVNEFSFDRRHPDADRIFRVYRWTEAMNGRDTEGDPYLPMPLAPAMVAELPDVEQAVRMREAWGENLVRVAGGEASRIGFTFADPAIFDLFSFPLAHGDPATALGDPQNIVLTASTARRLFGDTNVVGQTVEIRLEGDYEPFVVSAVAEDVPPNSSIVFEMLGSFERWASTRYGAGRRTNWGHSAYMTFVRLRPGSTLADDADRLYAFRKAHYPDEEAELRAEGRWQADYPPVTYRMQLLRTMHTDTSVWGGMVASVDRSSVWILIGIATGILAVAGINFTTLAIGRSAGRAREIGLRKVVGGDRRQLIAQFLAEALLLSLLSGFLGLGLGRLLLPLFNELSGKELSFALDLYPEIGWIVAGVVLVVGLLAGAYPAIVLSGLRPTQVFRKEVRVSGANGFTRSLVTVQFVVSIGLIAGMLVILDQLNYMRTRSTGFEASHVVVVDAEEVAHPIRTFERFRAELGGSAQVEGIASADMSLGEGAGWSRSGWDYRGQHKEVYEYYIDERYLDVMGMILLAGRGFDPAMASDSLTSVIVNEAFLRDFGWTAERAIGESLDGYYGNGRPNPVVIGVVRDFHFRSFREEVYPQLFHRFADYAPFQYLVRIAPGDPTPALQAIRGAWDEAAPDEPFTYSFLDEDIARFYLSEARWSRIVGWAGGISIFLACLGLFGLAALAAANRTKEIGIRKVLGATLGHVVGLLSRDFLGLVAVAIGVAVPLVWYFMRQWLEGFAYRVDVAWWHILLPGVIAALVALATVSTQALRVALADPVKSLRYE